MKFCTLVEKQNVLSTAIKLVNSAKTKILVTMNTDEEIREPLPEVYHNLLTKKAGQGIKIVRYGYGTRKSFLKLRPKSKNITFIYGGNLSLYQRMLLVDKSRGIFSLEGTVYLTKFKPLVNSLVKYVKTGYNRKEI